MTDKHSKTKTSYYRRLYVAHLIDTGINTVPQLLATTKMPKRTLQDTIVALAEMDIKCVISGGTKNRSYSIENWGAINKEWLKNNLHHVTNVLK
ncbi:MAG: helix-turn-helix domain-containing protein [Gammaproteobacteria bacterium]|nr:helix-turn-helix domain-containing protein [Gammaproteobacteria bacterium]